MRNLKIGQKLSITFEVILILLLVTVGVAIYSLSSLSSSFTDFYSVGYQVSHKATDMRRTIQSAIQDIAFGMLETDQQKAQDYFAEADTEMQILKEEFDYMEKNYRGDQSDVAKALEIMNSSVQYRTEVQDLATRGRNEEAVEVFFNSYKPLLTEAQDLLEKMDNYTTNLAADDYEVSMSDKSATMILLIIISAVALLTTIILAVDVTRRITKPIKEIEAAVKEMAGGNLDVTIAYESRDELGSLSNSVREMTGRLKAIISDEAYVLGELATGNFNVLSRMADSYVGAFQGILEAIEVSRRVLTKRCVRLTSPPIRWQAEVSRYPPVPRLCHREPRNRLLPLKNWQLPSMRFPSRLRAMRRMRWMSARKRCRQADRWRKAMARCRK